VTRIVILDTETTSLRHDRRVWEAGLIVRDPGRDDKEHHWFIRSVDLDLGNADLFSLQVGRFYDRHPDYDGLPGIGECAYPEEYVLREVDRLTRGAHLVGAVVSFDADVLATRMRANGICPSWHYHLIDVEALAVGYLNGLSRHGHSSVACLDGPCVDEDELPGLPWNSDELTRSLHIAAPGELDRHTALGDARWAKAIYDAVMSGGAS